MGAKRLKVIVRDEYEGDYTPCKNTVKIFVDERDFGDYKFVNDDPTMLMVSQYMNEQLLVEYLIDQDKDSVWFYISPDAAAEAEDKFRRIYEAYVESPRKPKTQV